MIKNTPEKFWSRIKKLENGCWEWQGARDAKGYGQLRFVVITGEGNGRGIRAHVVAYILTNGPIPDGLWVLHKCDNPPCCNPAHLFLGTAKDNGSDCASKKRTAWGERNGKTKFNAKRALNIIMAAAQGVPQNRLARIFGVHESTVSLLVRKKRWENSELAIDTPIIDF